ncbi:MAG: tetracycline regulation of excision, RteC [Flavobacterium sp.]|nr:MAG: tetracycline regulation of excision, RteC [Flavobacterium sp.]
MKAFSTSLMAELEEQLSAISNENDAASHAELATTALLEAFEKLKKFFIKYKFENEQEEILFFREVKPCITSRIIYYNDIYRIATHSPPGPAKCQRKYYLSEQEKLKHYFFENIEFYNYLRTGSTHMDHVFFVRGNYNIKLSPDSYFLQADSRFSTSHDYKVARILANQLLNEWLQAEVLKIEDPHAKASPVKKSKWTGSKVALTELLYALHAEGVFNDGNADLKEIATLFENAFNVNLGQYHRTFLELRARKTVERTKFLSSLRENLLQRMEDADEA